MTKSKCPNCSTVHEIPDHYIGREIKCPSCGSSYGTATKPPSETTDQRYKRELAEALSNKWIMLAEGPSGAQLELPKIMRIQTKVALIIGFLLTFAWGIGIIIIIGALIDYAMQKKQTKFIAKS